MDNNDQLANKGQNNNATAKSADANNHNNHNYNLDLARQTLGSSLKSLADTTTVNLTRAGNENDLLLANRSASIIASNSDNLAQFSLSAKQQQQQVSEHLHHHNHNHHHHHHHHHHESNSNDNSNNNGNRTTDAQTMMHILKANVGTGVLAMPNAFKNVGLWLGFVLVPIIGAICIHCMNILIESHNHLCDRFNYESLDYDQVAALGLACGPKFARRLAKWANGAVTVFLIITQFGFCCVYVMFVVENIQLAVLNLFKVQYSTTTYLLLVFPIIGLTSCTSNLKHLARISTFANILQLTGLSLIVFDLFKFHTYDNLADSEAPPIGSDSSAESPLINNNSTLSSNTHVNSPVQVVVNQFVSDDIKNGLPLFFATAVYAFEGIGVVLPLVKEMQHPDRISGWNGVLNSSMSMVALLYMAMGFFGYTKYGQFVQGSITLNLPQTNLNELVRFIFATAIGLSYSLQFYVPWTIMWPHIDESLFYSYRPRASRDKLQILNKLSKDASPQWASDESSFQQSASTVVAAANQQQQQHQPRSTPANGEQQTDYDNQSTATTLATSYTMSTTCPGATAGQTRRRNLNLSGSLGANYGGVSTSSFQQLQSGKSKPLALGRLRDRLDDVLEQELDEDSMPEVQWRPPPNSMRGRRKLVRYTVILVTVSFTFVAAALIPRLDLFIALIGALASSCLAIIFPAIIQLCTFWTPDADQSDEQQAGCSEEASYHSTGSPTSSLGGEHQKRKWRATTIWWLFVAKNFLLVVFGILGLITGSWISISQLSAAYLALPIDA